MVAVSVVTVNFWQPVVKMARSRCLKSMVVPSSGSSKVIQSTFFSGDGGGVADNYNGRGLPFCRHPDYCTVSARSRGGHIAYSISYPSPTAVKCFSIAFTLVWRVRNTGV